MGPRIFTVREANALLPAIEEILADLDAARNRIRKIKGKMDLLEMLWGDEVMTESNPDYKEHRAHAQELDKAAKDHEAVLERLKDLEVTLKSVESGLVDFCGVIDSRLVYLCWKRGEPEVGWYHHLDDGFAGRREIEPQYKAI
jgi:hypothetical protein